MTTATDSHPDADTILAVCDMNLINLCHAYLKFRPENTETDFANAFVVPYMQAPSTRGEGCLAQLREAMRNDPNGDFSLASLLTSAAYTAEAVHAVGTKEYQKAWICLSEARYWCGNFVAVPGLDDVRTKTINKTISATHSNMSTAGGLTRSENMYGAVKEEAYRLARSKRPPVKGWQSRSHAVRTIAEDVKRFAEKIGHPLSQTNGDDTIDGWLKDMPDADKLFPNRKNAKSK
jgi:hypothetical protein